MQSGGVFCVRALGILGAGHVTLPLMVTDLPHLSLTHTHTHNGSVAFQALPKLHFLTSHALQITYSLLSLPCQQKRLNPQEPIE